MKLPIVTMKFSCDQLYRDIMGGALSNLEVELHFQHMVCMMLQQERDFHKLDLTNEHIAGEVTKQFTKYYWNNTPSMFHVALFKTTTELHNQFKDVSHDMLLLRADVCIQTKWAKKSQIPQSAGWLPDKKTLRKTYDGIHVDKIMAWADNK